MIWIIGGTSETRELLEWISDMDYIVTVTTYAGVEALSGYNVLESRLDYENMLEFIAETKIKTIIDMSHPYAFEVSQNSSRAAAETGTSYIRFNRRKTANTEGRYFETEKELLGFLSHIEGTVFFTTGIKQIPLFESVRGGNRFIYRVLPTKFSIEACESAGVQLADIVASLGPFSKAYNMAMFQNYKADFVVMKDSGSNGGTEEKLAACRALHIEPLILGRADEAGASTIDEILERIR